MTSNIHPENIELRQWAIEQAARLIGVGVERGDGLVKEAQAIVDWVTRTGSAAREQAPAIAPSVPFQAEGVAVEDCEPGGVDLVAAMSFSLKGINESLKRLADDQGGGWKKLTAVPRHYGTPIEYLGHQMKEVIRELGNKLLDTPLLPGPRTCTPMEYLTKEMKEGLREMARIYIKWAADDKGLRAEVERVSLGASTLEMEGLYEQAIKERDALQAAFLQVRSICNMGPDVEPVAAVARLAVLIDEGNKDIKRAYKEARETAQERDGLQAEVDKLRSHLPWDRPESFAQIEALQAEVEHYKNDLDEQIKYAASLLDEIERLRAGRNGFEAQLERDRGLNSQVITALHQERDALQAAVEAIRRQVEARELTDPAVRVQGLEMDRQEHLGQIEALQAANQALQDQIALGDAALAHALRERDGARDNARRFYRLSERLKGQASEYQAIQDVPHIKEP